MSATRVLAPEGGAPAASTSRRRPIAPRLRLVPAPTTTGSVAGNGVFALFIAGLIIAGMALLLLLNTILATGAFQIQALTRQQQQLQMSAQALQLYVARSESPDALARAATRYGMVPVTSPGFLRLSDGVVLGAPVPAAVPRPVAPPPQVTKPASSGALNMAAVPSTGAHTPTTPATDAAKATSTGVTKQPAKTSAKKPTKPGATAGARG